MPRGCSPPCPLATQRPVSRALAVWCSSPAAVRGHRGRGPQLGPPSSATRATTASASALASTRPTCGTLPPWRESSRRPAPSMCWSATKACFSTSCNRRSYRSSPPPPAPARAAAPARPRRGKGRAFPRSVSPYLRHRRFDACAYATFFSSPPSPGNGRD